MVYTYNVKGLEEVEKLGGGNESTYIVEKDRQYFQWLQ